MNPILVTSGEPAGVGPDICLSLSQTDFPVVVMGDVCLLAERAQRLGLSIEIKAYQADLPAQRGVLYVYDKKCPKSVIPGQLNVANAAYVFDMLEDAVDLCQQHYFSGLVTAPVHKGILNDAGYSFSGHTELLQKLCEVEQVVMMLASTKMKVALATTHLPLREVANHITQDRLKRTIDILHHSLCLDFGISSPRIVVAGLNPHAGEGGYLGREEIEIIEPVLAHLRQEGMDLIGPKPADTWFIDEHYDAYLAMYHDQGLPLIKYADFSSAVNVTLGLPIIRTSVDHGTALSKAGTPDIDYASLWSAIQMAQEMAKRRNKSICPISA